MKLVIDIPEKMYEAAKTDMWCSTLGDAVKKGTPTGECKTCKYFEYDHVDKVNKIPLITAHEICTRWGEGCKTAENGFCFLYEKEGKTE